MYRVAQLLSLAFLACRSARAEDVDYQEAVNCDGAVVQVSSLEVLCDSNRTYYYGSSVHRNSPYCDEVDKATIAVDFDLGEDLEEGSDIYMTLAISNEAGDVVYEEASTSVCDYVGDECIYEGSYYFTKQVQLQLGARNQTNFLPLVQLAFSAKTKGSSDLGGVNLGNCGKGTVSSSKSGSSVGKIIGITMAVAAVIAVAVMFLYHNESDAPKRNKRGTSGPRMDQADYGIILGEGSTNSNPLISSGAPKEGGTDDDISSSSTSDNSQPSDPEDSSQYQAFDFEDHPKKMKRGQSLLRFLRGRSNK